MAASGAVARNLHEGSRSEYLAQYFLTAFGTAVLVPRPEDHGIDLYCTLGEAHGQRLAITKYYLVQVKSMCDPIVYESRHSVEWLTSHQYPLLVCVIDKKQNKAELYATTHLSRIRNMNLERVDLFPSESTDTRDDPLTINGTTASLEVGPPIIRQRVDEIHNRDNVKNVIHAWLDIDERNIRLNSIGLDMGIYPGQTKTNKLPTGSMTLKGNFMSHRTPVRANYYYDTFFFLLANEIHLAASEFNKERFEQLSDTAGAVIDSMEPNDSYGLRNLQIAINCGAEEVGSSRRLDLKVNGSQISTESIRRVRSQSTYNG